MKRTEFLVLTGIIGIVVMMVIPINPTLLSFLIMVNVFVSLTVLLLAMRSSDPLEFSVFPTLLLITTIFRLSLNISSTRLILSTGHPGKVIETFGSFVTKGNIVVGFIVFLIIVIVQFIVITRGAERVAEVAARFTLDAMPGKQISIDADLNAGIITDAEARDRRQRIEREADFYGAMDGASKFVKGDVIANMLIVAINIVGGFVVGVAMNHGSIGSTLSHYTILSIGDGLVSSIPALLLSTATGIIVTRANSANTLGGDLVGQFLADPRILYVVAAFIALLGLVTPIPMLVTWPISAIAVLVARRLHAEQTRSKQAEEEKSLRAKKDETKKPESVLSLLGVEPIEFEFGYGLIPLVDAKQGGDLLDRVVMIRRQLALEMGMMVPVIRLRDNISLKPSEYSIKIRGAEVANGEIMMGYFLAMSPGVDDPAVVGVPTKDPTFGLPALWVNAQMRVRAEASGYTVVDPASVVATHITEVLKRHAHELMGRQETKALLDHIKETAPALVDEVVPNNLTLGQVQRVLANLLRERVSIRDMITILETLADSAHITKDPDMLTEYVRQALGRQICHQFRVPDQPLTVLTFSPAVEETLQQSLVTHDNGTFIGLDPTVSQQVYRRLREESNRLSGQGKTSVLLTHPQLRMPVSRWLARYLPELVVLSYNELDPAVDIESGGVVNL